MRRSNLSINLLIFTCFFCFSAVAQTSSDVRGKFGSPTKETYQINPNLFLNIEYGDDNQACIVSTVENNIKLETVFLQDSDPLRAEKKARAAVRLASDLLLQGIFRPANWGKEIKDEKFQLGQREGNCFDSYRAEYENTSVYSYNSTCGKNSPSSYYVVEWKREQCKKVRENQPFHFTQ